MAFDLSTARRVTPQGFDISTAKSADRTLPRSQPETRPRAEVEAELAQREAAANKAQGDLDALAPFEEPVRTVGSALTNLAAVNPLVALPAMAEDAVAAIPDWIAGKPVVPRFFRGPRDLLQPKELAPRNDIERMAATSAQVLGGGLGGTAIGQRIAQTAASPVARAVGQAFADMPEAQLASAVTAPAAGQTARNLGLGETGQMLAEFAGGAAPFAAGRPPSVTTPIRGPGGPISDATSRARRMGFKITPDYAATEAQRTAGGGEIPSVPGRFRASFAGPEFDHATLVENSKQANTWVARDMGLPESTTLTPDMFAMAKNPHNAAFNRVVREVPIITPDQELMATVQALGADVRMNPLLEESPQILKLRKRLESTGQIETQYVLDAVRQWRRNARLLFQSADDPSKHEMAAAYRQAASAFEAAIERQAAATGNAQLVAELRNARTSLAKIHNYEDSMVGTDVDLRRLAKLGEKSPLTGVTAELANIGTHFPDIAQPATGVQRPTPSASGMLATVAYGLRRVGGEQLIPGLLSERFQGRYGEFDPNFNPGFTRQAPPGGPPRPTPPEGPLPSEGPLSLADEAIGPQTLPPELQAIVDVIEGRASEASLGDSFPAQPQLPVRRAARGSLEDELGSFGDTAGPNEFPDAGAPAIPRRPLPAAPGGAQAPLDGVLLDPLAPPLGNLFARPGAGRTFDQNGQSVQTTPAGFEGDVFERPMKDVTPPRAGAEELSLADDFARPEAADLTLAPSGPPLPKSSGKTRSGLDIYENVETNVLPDMATRKGDTILRGDGRTVILQPAGENSIAMRWTVVEEAMRERGLGSGQALDAVRYAAEKGRTLESDSSLTAGQIGVWKALFRDGKVQADRVPNWAEIDAAAESNGGIATNRAGESWIKGIRLGPNAE